MASSQYSICIIDNVGKVAFWNLTVQSLKVMILLLSINQRQKLSSSKRRRGTMKSAKIPLCNSLTFYMPTIVEEAPCLTPLVEIHPMGCCQKWYLSHCHLKSGLALQPMLTSSVLIFYMKMEQLAELNWLCQGVEGTHTAKDAKNQLFWIEPLIVEERLTKYDQKSFTH